MNTYYNSVTSKLIEEGAGDLHCRSDQYLVDELWLEVQRRQSGSESSADKE